MSDNLLQTGHGLRALNRLDRTLTAASPLALAVIGVSSLYYVAFSYGLAVVGLLFGKDSVTQVFCNNYNNSHDIKTARS